MGRSPSPVFVIVDSESKSSAESFIFRGICSTRLLDLLTQTNDADVSDPAAPVIMGIFIEEPQNGEQTVRRYLFRCVSEDTEHTTEVSAVFTRIALTLIRSMSQTEPA